MKLQIDAVNNVLQEIGAVAGKGSTEVEKAATLLAQAAKFLAKAASKGAQLAADGADVAQAGAVAAGAVEELVAHPGVAAGVAAAEAGGALVEQAVHALAGVFIDKPGGRRFVPSVRAQVAPPFPTETASRHPRISGGPAR